MVHNIMALACEWYYNSKSVVSWHPQQGHSALAGVQKHMRKSYNSLLEMEAGASGWPSEGGLSCLSLSLSDENMLEMCILYGRQSSHAAANVLYRVCGWVYS